MRYTFIPPQPKNAAALEGHYCTGAYTGNSHYLNVRTVFSQLDYRFNALNVRHYHVSNNNVELAFIEKLQCLPAVAGFNCLMPVQ